MNGIMKLNRAQSGFFIRLTLVIISTALLSGCASTEMTASNPYTGPLLPKPARILVYDFTSSLSEVPSNSPLQRQLAGLKTTQSPENVQLSQRLGAQVANDLASSIREMGLPGVRAMRGTTPKPNDVVFRGYFLTMEEGSAAERMALGFGKGAAELKVHVEAYRMTAQGMQFLGSGEGTAGSGKTPGTALSLGVAVATANPVGIIVGGAVKAAGEASGKETIEGASSRIAKLISKRLETAFEQQGWI